MRSLLITSYVTKLAAAVALVVGSGSTAVADIRVGGTAGASLGYSNESNSEFDQFKFGGGPIVEWRPGLRVGVRSGVLWRPSGSGFSSIIPEISDASVRLSYIAVLVGAVYTPRPQSSVPIGLTAGLEVARLLKATEEARDGESEIKLDLTDDFTPWDLALSLGLAVPASRSLEFALEHRWGLRALDDHWIWENVRYRAFWLSAAYWFDIAGHDRR